MRLSRILDPVEIRVLGCLLEKERTTPDAYPLTLNALVTACNQKSSRFPVMHLADADVSNALDRLHAEVMVWPVTGARVDRWRHALERKWDLDGPKHAVLALLMLRGPMTPGAIRNRSERLHAFDDNRSVERVLEDLAEGEEPLTVLLERQPGQNEARWMHLVGGPPDPSIVAASDSEERSPSTAQRLADLEARIDRLEAALATLTGPASS